MEILGIPVSPALLSTWRGWLMPKGQQPFVVPDHVAHDRGLVAEPQRLTMEFQDSFCIYGDDVGRTYWLTRAQSRALPPAVRADQPAPHRWPSLNFDGDVARVVRFVSKGRRCSRHAEVPASAWRAAGGLLPEARQLAGRFPNGSGPNCFGTVMAAAGVEGAAQTWMQREPFEEWLDDRTVPGGLDERSGTVMVWRSDDGAVQHAAVTIGDGYALSKPSQGWMSPTKVLTALEAKQSARHAGLHLYRYTMT